MHLSGEARKRLREWLREGRPHVLALSSGWLEFFALLVLGDQHFWGSRDSSVRDRWYA
jgi:hypothetical protein